MWVTGRKDGEDEPFIKHEIIDEVEHVIDNCGEQDYAWKTWEHKSSKLEQIHLSELCDMFKGLSQADFAIAVIFALENYPEMVIEIIKDYVRVKIVDKEKKRHENREDV